MKALITSVLVTFLCAVSFAQVGVGTTSPHSTLDVRGSLSTAYRAFTANTSAATSDNMLVFTGTSAASITLPDAIACVGRSYWIKNASSNTSLLTIATTSSQTVDGLASWILDEVNEGVRVVSNGANWYISSQTLPAGSGTSWTQGGNSVASARTIGTLTNFDLPFVTNNTEKMRLTAAGRLGIGTSTFNGTHPEKLLVDAGTTTSVNAIVGKGTINNYLQLNIQNLSNGANASSDVVATANNGSETTNYVDLGINGGSNTSGIMGVANDAYLYNVGQNFLIGTGTAAKSLVFMTGGTTQSTNERMRIDGNGNVGIGLDAIPKAAIGAAKFAIDGVNSSMDGPHMQFTTSADDYPLLNVLPWQHDNVSMSFDGYWDGSNWKSSTSTGGNFQFFKNNGKFAMRYANVNTQGGTIAAFNDGLVMDVNGNVAIGTGTWNATSPEQLLVDAGSSTYNVISGKGNLNNYLQLNIQNSSGGNQASSDIVATANNGTETQNYVNMGINSSGYTSSASSILSGPNNAYFYSTGSDLVMGNATGGKNIIFFNGGTNSSNEIMRITSSGNLAIGTTTANDKLVIAGNIAPSADNSYTLGRSGIRWSAVWSANGTIQTSDFRLKKNISPLTYGLNEVMKMQPVSYDWKDKSGSHKIGLIAQDIKKIVPEVVSGDEEKENLGMNYAELVPVLINAIKDLKKDLEETKKELGELKKQLVPASK
jgi:hypothetical protein